MFQKKRGEFIQKSPFLVQKYFQRQKSTIPSSKIFPSKNVAKKEVGFRTEFTIPSYLIFPEENTSPRAKIFPTKKLEKKRGYVLHNPLLSYKISALRARKIQYKQQISALHKMFPIPTKNVGKIEGVCRAEFTVILENFRMWGQINKIQIIEFCVTKYFLQKMLQMGVN